MQSARSGWHFSPQSRPSVTIVVFYSREFLRAATAEPLENKPRRLWHRKEIPNFFRQNRPLRSARKVLNL